MNRKLSLVIFCLFLMPCVVRAEVPLELYRVLNELPESEAKIADYITGVGKGIIWANAFMDSDRLFCTPKNIVMNAGIIRSLLNQEIRTPHNGTPYESDTFIEAILIASFKSRFPCKK